MSLHSFDDDSFLVVRLGIIVGSNFAMDAIECCQPSGRFQNNWVDYLGAGAELLIRLWTEYDYETWYQQDPGPGVFT